MIKVLIVEDSIVTQRILVALLEDEPGIEVVGIAENGVQAVEMCHKLQPDLVTMDVYMPQLDGIQATRRIMQECPTRIVIISSMANSADLARSFEAMSVGAIELIEKPYGALQGNYSQVKAELTRVLKKMIQARPLAQLTWQSTRSTPPAEAAYGLDNEFKSEPLDQIPRDFVPAVVCIGGSTGAPAVLERILSGLPDGFSIPIVIVQHISSGFVPSMAAWLDSCTPLRVGVADKASVLEPGAAIVAPGDHHLRLVRDRKVRLVPPQPEARHIPVPSVDMLFESAAEVYGGHGLGIILSGMGTDGAAGLLAMRHTRAVTLGQDETSSVVYGMPKAAAENGAVMQELTPRQIVYELHRMHYNCQK